MKIQKKNTMNLDMVIVNQESTVILSFTTISASML